MPARQRTAREKAQRQARDAARRLARATEQHREEGAMPEQYVCRWPSGFLYDGIPLDVGQVLVLHQCPNDEQLVRMRYLVPLEGTPRLATCGPCGAEFVSEMYRDGHGRKRHSGRAEAPSGVPAGAGLAMEDRSSTAEDRLNEAALRGEG
jgi:hypothetical protein